MKFIKIDWQLIPVDAILEISGDLCDTGCRIDYILKYEMTYSYLNEKTNKYEIHEFFHHGDDEYLNAEQLMEARLNELNELLK